MKFKTRAAAKKWLKDKKERGRVPVPSDFTVRKIPGGRVWKFTVATYLEWLNGIY